MSKKWYVVHAYSGFEKSVKRALLSSRTCAPTAKTGRAATVRSIPELYLSTVPITSGRLGPCQAVREGSRKREASNSQIPCP